MSNKILDHLSKLLNHQRSAERIGSLHEAELFADKIQELLDEYNLSMSDIEIKEAPIDVDKELFQKCFKRGWKRDLIHGIADVNSCQLVYDPPRMLVIGSNTDRRIVLQLYEYFYELGEHLSNLAGRAEKAQYGSIPPKFKGSFMDGYATTLAYRLRKRHREAMERAAEANQTSTALIFIGDKMARAETFVKENIATTQVKRNRNVGNWDAYGKGRNAANSISLNDETIEEQGRPKLR